MDGLTATYVVLFVAGSGFSVVSWLLGTRGHHAHAPHGHAGRASLPTAHGGKAALLSAHGGKAALAHGGKAALARGGKGGATHGAFGKLLVPFANLTALSALACVGGGVGWLARLGGLHAIASLGAAVPTGLGAAYGVGAIYDWLEHGTRFAARLEPGTVATVLAAIGEGRTGEVVYTAHGARHALPAVSEAGRAIGAGTEVVVLEVKDGVARVAPSNEVFGEEAT